MAKRCFLVVADLNTRNVVKVWEGPNEQGLHKTNIKLLDEKLFKKRRALLKQFPMQNYDVILAREENYKRLKNAFPELHGWENVTPKPF